MNSYQDWKKENPNGTINDFYKHNPQVSNRHVENVQFQNPNAVNSYHGAQQPIIINQIIKASPEFDLLNIIVSIVAMGSLLLSWIDASYLSISVIKLNGFDLHEMVKIMNAFQGSESNIFLINSFYLIPGGAFFVLVGELIKKESVVIIGQVINILAIGLWSYLFWNVTKEQGSYDLIGIGFYVALACGIVYLIKLFSD